MGIIQIKKLKKAELWLKFISNKQNIYIRHAKNGGEFKVGEYFLDGICEENKTIYEFHGCLWHGCQKCYSSNTWNKIKQKTMGSIFESHCKRIKFIKQALSSYKLVEIWECDFDSKIKNDIEYQRFIKSNPVSIPLIPRDALYGGRTNALKLYHKCVLNQKTKYIDYTSLYPYSQKYGKYPIGHPQIITENFNNFNEYFGLIKCKIIPPRNLYIPVLPARINNKLVFTLCYQCALEKLDKCSHTDNERAIEGTWVTLEVQKAIEKGYKIANILEIWHWNETSQYDSSSKSGGLFTKYINTALKEKQEASGYPKDVKTEQERRLIYSKLL